MINLITQKDEKQSEDDFLPSKFLQGSNTFCNMLSPKWGCLRLLTAHTDFSLNIHELIALN